MSIFELLKSNNLDEFFLELNDYNVQEKDINGNTILHFAVSEKKIDVARRLIDQYNVDVNVRDSSNYTPLLIAVLQQDLEMIKMLLYRNASLVLENDIGLTPIYVAVQQSNLQITQLLWEKYKASNLLLKLPFGCTLLHCAADSINSNGYNDELINFLLSIISEKELQQVDNLGRTVYDAFSDKGDYYFDKFKNAVSSSKQMNSSVKSSKKECLFLKHKVTSSTYKQLLPHKDYKNSKKKRKL